MKTSGTPGELTVARASPLSPPIGAATVFGEDVRILRLPGRICLLVRVGSSLRSSLGNATSLLSIPLQRHGPSRWLGRFYKASPGQGEIPVQLANLHQGFQVVSWRLFTDGDTLFVLYFVVVTHTYCWNQRQLTRQKTMSRGKRINTSTNTYFLDWGLNHDQLLPPEEIVRRTKPRKSSDRGLEVCSHRCCESSCLFELTNFDIPPEQSHFGGVVNALPCYSPPESKLGSSFGSVGSNPTGDVLFCLLLTLCFLSTARHFLSVQKSASCRRAKTAIVMPSSYSP
jgi:hypothetical protein